MTRAKNKLTIHLNSSFLDRLTADNLERIEDREIYFQPQELVMHLSLKDVWLDYFINRQYNISRLTSGDILTINEDSCIDKKGNSILKFSRQFMEQIISREVINYKLKTAKVNFIVYWKKEDSEQEVKVVLPELYFERERDEGMTT